MLTRRDMLFGTAATVAIAGCKSGSGFFGAAGKDPNLSVFLSDIHVAYGGIQTKWGPQPVYQNALFERTIDEILAMRPRPARVVIFGDIALWFGYRRDYETSLPLLKRLTAAGIDLYLTTGNHDHRLEMFECHPRQAEITPVPGRFVSDIDLGSCDLLLLDTLHETGQKEGDGNDVGGDLDDAQMAWLENRVKTASRPFFCGGHHSPRDLHGRDVRTLLRKCPLFVGWIHGHDHKFSETWFSENYADGSHIRRIAVLPSTGWWGDIGYVTFRTCPDRAVLALEEKDFFFPRPLKPGGARPADWDLILAEHRGRSVTFTY